jgi:hypothetical protein
MQQDTLLLNIGCLGPTPQPESNFGTWSITASVAVSDFTVADTLKFSVNYLVNIANNGMQLPVIVNRQSTLNLMVTIDSIASPAVSSTLIVTVYDDAKVPLGSFVATGEYGAGNSTVLWQSRFPHGHSLVPQQYTLIYSLLYPALEVFSMPKK